MKATRDKGVHSQSETHSYFGAPDDERVYDDGKAWVALARVLVLGQPPGAATNGGSVCSKDPHH